MLHKLTMKNFKQHKDLVVEFTEGLNAIQGENGAGKSTILKAILFARFGVSAAGASDHLTNYDAEKPMSVVLEETLPGFGRVTVERSLNKAVVSNEGGTIASGQGPVTRFFEDRLGMPYRIFKTLLYAQQKKVDNLLELGPSGLQKHLELIANIEIVDKILKLIHDDEKEAQGILEGLGPIGDIDGIAEQHRQVSKQLLETKASLASTIKELEEAQSAYQKAKAEYERGVSSMMTSSRIKSELSGVAGSIETLSEQLIRIRGENRNPVDENILQALQTQIIAAKDLLKKKSENLYTYKQLLKTFKENEEFIRVSRKYEDVLVVYDSHKTTVSYQADMLDEAKKAVSVAEASLKSATCPTCRRPFDQMNIEEMMATLAKANQVKEQEEVKLKKAQQDLEDFYTTVNIFEPQWPMIRKNVDKARLMMEGLTEPVLGFGWKSLEEAEQDITASSITSDNLVKSYRDRDEERVAYTLWLSNISKLETQIEEKQSKAMSLQTQYQECNAPSEEALKEMKAQLDKRMSEFNLLVVRKQDYVTLEANSAARQEALSIQLDAETKKKTRILDIYRESADRQDLQKFLRDNRAAFTNESWAALTSYVSHLLDNVTEGFLTNLRRADNGEFFVNEAGRPIPVEEVSGARQAFVGLCLRLGLAHLFYGQEGVVLLDEVTADCSESNSARVAGMLRGLKSQVILVTHRQADALNAQNTICLA